MTASSDIPVKWTVPWAQGDTAKVEIPVTSSDSTRASLTLGFPPLTMQPPESGGVPPQGEDFNGGMNQIARVAWWLMQGGGFPYDSTFAKSSAISGYPRGAVIPRADLSGCWLNLADANMTDPDTTDGTAASWIPVTAYGSYALTGQTGGTVVVYPVNAAHELITVSGALTSNLVLQFPAWIKRWCVTNNTSGNYTVTVKTASGSGVVVPQNGAPTVLTGDGTNITQPPQNIASGTSSTHAATVAQTGGRLLRVTRYRLQSSTQYVAVDGGSYSTTGATTFTSHSLATRTIAKIQGAGGGAPGTPSTGGSNVAAAPGGTGGAFAEVLFTGTAPFNAAPVTVGLGGEGGAAGLTTSSAGGDSVLGSGSLIATAPGGPAVSPTAAGSPPLIAGGASVSSAPTTTGGFLLKGVCGAPGFYGICIAQNTASVGGTGGNAGDGGAGRTGGTNAAGASAPNPGAGGAGGSQSAANGAAQAGGDGASGYIVIYEYA